MTLHRKRPAGPVRQRSPADQNAQTGIGSVASVLADLEPRPGAGSGVTELDSMTVHEFTDAIRRLSERGQGVSTFLYCSPLSGSIYVARRRRVVKEHGDGTATFEVIGSKDVVTEDAIRAVIEHVRGCCAPACVCLPLRQAEKPA